MKPEEDKYYGVTELTVWNVVVLLANSSLCVKNLLSFSRSSKVMGMVILETYHLLKIAWTPLLEPRFNYEGKKILTRTE